jgi:hypothetical protein
MEEGKQPLSNRERQEALRARRAMLGYTEVRGVYLPPELHAELKSLARLWAERLERARAKDQAASEPSEG